MSQLKSPFSHSHRAGKSAFFMSKQLTFKKFFRKSCTIYRNEWL